MQFRPGVKKILVAHIRQAVFATAAALQVPVNSIAKKVIPVLTQLSVNSFNERRRYPRVRLKSKMPVRTWRIYDDWDDDPTNPY